MSSRTIRSPGVVERLERSRDRIRERRALARQRERVITEAVQRYLTDRQAITACEAKRDNEIKAPRQQITDVELRAVQEIVGYRADQAEAAAVIRDHGQTDDDVAELLEISPKQARQLNTTARAHRATPSSDASPTSTAASSEHTNRTAARLSNNTDRSAFSRDALRAVSLPSRWENATRSALMYFGVRSRVETRP
jgi:hypothetical protein